MFYFWKQAKLRRGYSASARRVFFESLEPRRLLASLPFGANANDTAEFMLGSVVVTPVFLESSGATDPNIENWNSGDIQQTLDKIDQAMDWWVESLARLNTVHDLSFTIDTTFATSPAASAYEPINRRSNDYVLYVNEFLQNQGYTSGNIESEMRKFNNDQREKFGTDWAFTIIVANSEFQNSQDQSGGQFALGGSFRRAFGFAGGLFMVVPSSRPASTFAHETGHMFWARDEYSGGGTYFSERGYYNSRNENASDNPTPGFVQQPSIMASGTLHDTAYANFTSAPSTFAQIGWQDSDSDGIFDVLDEPIKLEGSGYWDVAGGVYRFSGAAQVQTLPNLNSSGLKNDITLNRIRQIEYRIDGGNWQVFSQPNQYEVDLDLAIPVPANSTTIEIRARDNDTTVTSNIFEGRLDRADAAPVPGIQGFVWLDENDNALRDVGELGEAGWTITLVNGSGQPLELRKSVEPDSLSVGAIGSAAVNGVEFVAIGSDTDGRVGVLEDSGASTGGRVFSAYSIPSSSFVASWTTSSRQLRANFVNATSTVSMDAIGASADSFGRLEAYNSSGQLLARYPTGALALGQAETMTVSSGNSDIAYIIASGTGRTSIKLDNLQYGPQSSTVTSQLGYYQFPWLAAGNYTVQATPVSGWEPLSPQNGQANVAVASNTPTTDVDFGFSNIDNPWHNFANPNDVNNDGRISPIDALQVINLLNSRGPGELEGSGVTAPPYVDVNADGRATAIDALIVINYLNERSGGDGEGEGGFGFLVSDPGHELQQSKLRLSQTADDDLLDQLALNWHRQLVSSKLARS